MTWNSPSKKPERLRHIVVQTNYGFMCGFRDYNGMFTPYNPFSGNVLRALRNGDVRLIRWRYKYETKV